MAKEPGRDTSDLAGSTETLLEAAANERAEVFERLSLLTQARSRGASRELALRSAEGRAEGAAASLSRAELRATEMARAAELARVPELAAVKQKAVLHGRVVNPRGLGEPGLVVVVLDERGREAARVQSAEVGYFCFTFPPDTRAGGPKREVEAAAPVAQKPATSEPPRESSVDQVDVRLEVRSANGKVLAREEQAITLARGTVVFRELTVKVS